MTIKHAWVVSCGLLLLAADNATAQSAPAAAELAALVNKLGSDQHRVREEALIALAQGGAGSVAPLLAGAQSKDPELAWRATETLQVVCQTVDLQGDAAVQKELTRASTSTNPAEAALAKRLLLQWPILRHNYAAAQLELLGAEIADVPLTETTVTPAPGGFIPGGGGFFGGILPPLPADGEELLIAEEAGIAGFAMLIAADPEPKPRPADAPLIGGLLRAFGLIADEMRALELEDEVEEAAERKADEIEVEVEVEEVEVLMEVDFAAPAPAMAADVVWTAPGSEAGGDPDKLTPGTLRIGKEWRGGDAGLEYVALLQQVHTIIFKDAPLTDAALAQVRKLRSLQQFRISGTPLSSAALLAFHQQRPQVAIQAPGTAMLGVVGVANGQGMLVQQVQAESGARRAGLTEQDVIAKVAGLKVANQNDVTLALYDKAPGQQIKVEYMRGGKRQTVAVVLSTREETQPAPVVDYPAGVQFFAPDGAFRMMRAMPAVDIPIAVP